MAIPTLQFPSSRLSAAARQRPIVTRDGFKHIFNSGDYDEVYALNRDPGELRNVVDAPEYAATVARLRQRLKRAAAEARDPIQDKTSPGCSATGKNLSGQFEAAGMIHGSEKP